MGLDRSKRISEEIKKIVSKIIMNGLKDPRISKLTSITHVEVTRDLRFANIFISVYDPNVEDDNTIEGLNSAKGYIRKEIGKELKLHYTPEPIFKKDDSIQNGMHINDILSKLSNSNEDKNKDDDEDEK
ncbi:30S ribosome-binding factor RbfA [Helicovermis profundi]|uniref:Ribosome-binding factor A n=1 Tax=Helicovermis profundi TaxID=3065157 RepID=A0AAU9EDA0_9FIRM|nr:30S ribosome-binding factor RbfA [Clostridia bacterium S502]